MRTDPSGYRMTKTMLMMTPWALMSLFVSCRDELPEGAVTPVLDPPPVLLPLPEPVLVPLLPPDPVLPPEPEPPELT